LLVARPYAGNGSASGRKNSGIANDARWINDVLTRSSGYFSVVWR
jgi:hypothetical protein